MTTLTADFTPESLAALAKADVARALLEDVGAADLTASLTRQVSLAEGSSPKIAASAHAEPQITADSRANIRAFVRLAGSIKEAVKSAAPTSSSKARATSALASAARDSGVKSAVKVVITS